MHSIIQKVHSIIQEVRRYIQEVHSYSIQNVFILFYSILFSIMQEVRSSI